MPRSLKGCPKAPKAADTPQRLFLFEIPEIVCKVSEHQCGKMHTGQLNGRIRRC